MEKIRILRAPDPDPKVMSFVEHLDELRRRLIIIVAAVCVGALAGWFLQPPILKKLGQPLFDAMAKHPKQYPDPSLIVTSVYGAFTLHLKMSLIIGLIFASPVVMWELWGFVAPALPGRFHRAGPLVVGAGLILFILGGVTAYLVMPLAIGFFVNQAGDLITIFPDASQYISFVSLIILVFGVSFELPLVLVMLCMAGVTNSGWLWRKRVIAFFIIFAVATIITPGADWISPLVLGAILFVLYLGSIAVARALGH